MWYSLSNGKQVDVRFNHQYREATKFQKVTVSEEAPSGYIVLKEYKPFQTDCQVSVYENGRDEEGVTFESVSKCHSGEDQFNKLKGRIHTLDKIFKYMNSHKMGLNKSERRELFNQIFPKFQSKAKTQRSKWEDRTETVVSKPNATLEVKTMELPQYVLPNAPFVGPNKATMQILENTRNFFRKVGRSVKNKLTKPR